MKQEKSSRITIAKLAEFSFGLSKSPYKRIIITGEITPANFVKNDSDQTETLIY